MKLIFHGAANEVGRSCIEINSQGERYLLDFGVKFVRDGFLYPEKVVDYGAISGVLVSHAHLDHSGGLPLLKHHCLSCPIFMTHQSLAIAKVLLKDSYKIAHIKHLHPVYEKVDINAVSTATKRVQFNKWYKHKTIKFKYLNAGHIPGSAFIVVEVEGKKLLYTGDFNTRTTQLMAPADFAAVKKELGQIDIMLTESTYGHRKLPLRSGVEKDFIASVKKVIAKGGSVLIPVFAVGRAQEILILLAKEKWKCPIYFDGMAKTITRDVLTNQSTYVVNKDALQKMYFKVVQTVSSSNRRKLAAQTQPAIFVTTSGMMQGGPAIDYLKHMWHDPKNAVFLTGYQVKGTNGHRLVETGEVRINGIDTQIRCDLRKFDFSGHVDFEDLKKSVKLLNPKNLIVIHGDPESVENLVEWAKSALDGKVYGPKIGDVITL